MCHLEQAHCLAVFDCHLHFGFNLDLHNVITARKRSCGKVIFSVVSVCLQVEGTHVTIIHNALDLIIR